MSGKLRKIIRNVHDITVPAFGTCIVYHNCKPIVVNFANNIFKKMINKEVLNRESALTNQQFTVVLFIYCTRPCSGPICS